MIYIFAFISSFSMLTMALLLLVLIFKGKDLGYLTFHISYVIYFMALFTPLFYGSVGSFYQWTHSEIIYSYSWLSFVLGIAGFYASIFLLEKLR